MKRKHFAYLICLIFISAWSCGRMESYQEKRVSENKILQQENGTVSLELEKAGRYCDQANPSNNTADWNVVISKPGRFKVWLTSETKDTSDLTFMNSVRISMLDHQLEGNPAVDKIVPDASNPSYYRADSYMGSVYVSEPGEYNIQIISEKVTAKNMNIQLADTKLMSLSLTPELR